MSNEEILERMKTFVEKVVKEKMKDSLSTTGITDKKSVAKSIITELDKVMTDEAN